ncbi:molybdenum cofactor biosynthesis protein B [Verticiella sediminum]|uniref:Molybdenum cofactor biosynthesis protein B n=1 Tax=Verticiella sediminum TaxID=1247510 RepID=A0A556A884_9BURK|nr:molybdenum cofactor biosynthesis protein B [Verticiella sediminum]TSH89098.1 molybdenum cofactor biosynthesis protein B [Verticiella sediminum]
MSKSLKCAVLTVSDTRDAGTDTSGNYLAETLARAGHEVVARQIVKDDIYRIRKVLSDWIADDCVQVIITTGGTGFSHRDSTPEAVLPLLDKEITGFGELFRYISFKEIGSATLQSRAVAGQVNRKLVFCLPGSTHACETAWEGILKHQFDETTKPCNFATQFDDA